MPSGTGEYAPQGVHTATSDLSAIAREQMLRETAHTVHDYKLIFHLYDSGVWACALLSHASSSRPAIDRRRHVRTGRIPEGHEAYDTVEALLDYIVEQLKAPI